MKSFLSLLLTLLVSTNTWGAIGVNTLWEINGAATAANVNGGGFNPANANFPTNYTATSANTSAPVLSTASYNFVAGDVDHWVYVKSGSNWNAGTFCKIASVASNNATLDAAIGRCLVASGNQWIPNTTVGVATVASPTGGTVGIDYSRSTAARTNNTDLAVPDGDAGSPTGTSAGSPFGVNMVGNHVHITAGSGYTASWYEIVSISGSTATFDRAVGTDGAKTNGTFYMGGAISLGDTTDDAFFEGIGAGNMLYVKYGTTITLSATAISISKAGTALNNIIMQGYNTYRHDYPFPGVTPQPQINTTAGGFITGTHWQLRNIHFRGDAAVLSATVTTGTSNVVSECTIQNFESLAVGGGSALFPGNSTFVVNNDITAPAGYCINQSLSNPVNWFIDNNYIHDCPYGLYYASTGNNISVTNNVFRNNPTNGIYIAGSMSVPVMVQRNTFIGVNNAGNAYEQLATGRPQTVQGNLFWGWSKGVVHTGAQKTQYSKYNLFYNNTTNADTWVLDPQTDVTTCDPGFHKLSLVTGTTATTSGGDLVDSGKNFTALGVVANRDFARITSGTGVTVGIYPITAVAPGGDNTKITLLNVSNDATADKNYVIQVGANFAPGGACVKGKGAGSYWPGGYTRQYRDAGAIQRREYGRPTGGR